jgi:uncharacterized membrane protein YgcG
MSSRHSGSKRPPHLKVAPPPDSIRASAENRRALDDEDTPLATSGQVTITLTPEQLFEFLEKHDGTSTPSTPTGFLGMPVREQTRDEEDAAFERPTTIEPTATEPVTPDLDEDQHDASATPSCATPDAVDEHSWFDPDPHFDKLALASAITQPRGTGLPGSASIDTPNAHRRRPATHHQKPAVRDGRPSENNEQPGSPSADVSRAPSRRRRAALGGLTATVLVVLAAIGANAFTGGQRTTRRVAEKRALASASTIRTPLLAPVADKFTSGYATVVFATRRVGAKLELAAARRRRELQLKRRREAEAAAAVAAAQAARARAAAAAAAAPQPSPVVASDSAGSSGGASTSTYQPPARSTGSSNSQSSSGTAKSSGSSGSASSGSGSSGSGSSGRATTSTPTTTGPICYPGTLGCWPGGPATK